jgi:outer membrane protein OmpA-like peptidoglycan-associated protein
VPATARRKGGRLPLAGLLIAGALAAACAAQAPPPPPAATPAAAPTRADLVVLLPGRDGKVGAVVVQEGGRETVLNTAYASAQTGADGRLDPGQASPDQVRAIFGDALAAEPPRPVTFILYFVEATDQFTPESQALVDQIMVAIASRPAPELTVAGHTDAVGTDQYNDTLSLRRAERVRALLITRGIAPDNIRAIGRGKREPRVPTPDGVAEPRNRRVEITVR